MNWEEKEDKIKELLQSQKIDGDEETLWHAVKSGIPPKKKKHAWLPFLLLLLGFLAGSAISSLVIEKQSCDTQSLENENDKLKQTIIQLHNDIATLSNTKTATIIDLGHDDSRITPELPTSYNRERIINNIDTPINSSTVRQSNTMDFADLNSKKSTLADNNIYKANNTQIITEKIPLRPSSVINNKVDIDMTKSFTPTKIKYIKNKPFYIGLSGGLPFSNLTIKNDEHSGNIQFTPALSYEIEAGIKQALSRKIDFTIGLVYRKNIQSLNYEFITIENGVVIDTSIILLNNDGSSNYINGPVTAEVTSMYKGKKYNHSSTISVELGLNYQLFHTNKFDIGLHSLLGITAFSQYKGILPNGDGGFNIINQYNIPINPTFTYGGGISVLSRHIKNHPLEFQIKFAQGSRLFNFNQTNYNNQSILSVVGVRFYY